MPTAASASDETPAPTRRAHFAARIEDRIHAFRERRARQRGLVPTIIPFAGYGGDGWVRVLARVILQKPDRRAPDRSRGIRGWRSFTSIHVAHAAIEVEAGGVVHAVTADRGGLIDVRLEAALEPGWQELRLTIEGADAVIARVLIVDPQVRFGIVSDIDDTVVVTALPRPFVAAWNTFVLNEHARRPVPGMPVLFDRIMTAHPGAPIVYVSTGAWNTVLTLNRFLDRHLYPRGPLLLTDWGPTLDGWFRSGAAHKRSNLRRLVAEFPDIRWLLVGDDGQHDEERYAELVADHPGSVAAVAIRRLTRGEAVLAGGRSPHDRHEGKVPWVWGSDGAELAEELSAIGILPQPRA